VSKGVYFFSEELLGYDMGPQHPLKPIRLRRTHDLLKEYGALDQVDVREPQPCSIEDLRTTHDDEFIRAVDYLSETSSFPHSYRRFGFGSGDNPVFPGMFEASRLYTGGSVDAAQAVLDGECRVAMNLSGGLHHAHRGSAAGFCIFNDPAVAIHRLRKQFDRVAYVDIDVHHGDGVQEAFYDDAAVLTISIHQTGQTLFPGTGFVSEIGEGDGRGYSVNVPVWPFTTDEVWLHAWRSAALPILKAFNPNAILLQMGADPHYLDPLAHVSLTAQGWLEAVKDVNGLGKPIVAVGGGGYNQTTVPRMWALAFSELYQVSLPDKTPETYYYHAQISRLTDAEPPDIDTRQVEEARRYADHTIAEVERTLFPFHGLT
jgi:acetoin utilization protein AcuC